MDKIYVSYSQQYKETGFIINRLLEHFYETNICIVKRESENFYGDNIRQSITELIDSCSMFICFINKDDTEIMFELGYALGKNKKVILIGDYKDIPYDLRNLSFIRQSEDISDILFHIEKHLNFSKDYTDDIIKPKDYSMMLNKALHDPNYLDSIEPLEFERIVYEWICSNGINAEMNTQNRDSGYDLTLFTSDGKRIIIEIKKYRHSSKVSISTIRQLIGTMVIEHIDVGIIITSGQYTNAAYHFINGIEQKIHLWTIENLIDIRNSINALI